MIVNPSWEKVQLYFSGDEYFKAVIQAIDQAQEEILVESYIFDYDPIGLRVLQALKRAQDRGVRVQLLVDAIGSFNWLSQIELFCRNSSINFRAFHPLPWQTKFFKRMSWRKIRVLLLLLKKMNRRNHRKFFLIDHNTCFLGSMNVSQVHTKEFLGNRAWRDTAVLLVGESNHQLRFAFLHAWFTANLKKSVLRGSLSKFKSRNQRASLLRLNTTLFWRYSHLRDLNKRIKTCQNKILITNAYFVPRRSILRNLRKAARRGIEVKICLPAQSDVWFVRWAAKSLYYKMLKSGIQIYEYSPYMLHAKTMIIDEWATVGSHNLNHRSLLHDLEVEAILTDRASIAALNSQWERDQSASQKITLSTIGRLNIFERALAQFTYWFRYWM